MSATKLPRAEILLLVAAVAAGAVLRLVDLDAPRTSPDEGNYLFSAGIHRIERGAGAGGALAEDLAWAWPRYYPHSYLHQLAARWARRAGAGAVEAIRIDSALLGTLSALLAAALAARVTAGRREPPRRAGVLLAGAVVALSCLHVGYARTGWGQTGCTTFFALYLLLGHALFGKAGSPARDGLLAAGMAVAALAAYGWHEMIVVHVAGMGIFVLVHHAAGGPGFEGRGIAALPRTLARSRKAWLALASAAPILVLFASLFGSEFARRHWLELEREGRGIGDVLRYLFPLVRVDRQIGWPVIALGAVGLVSLWRRDRFSFRYLATALVASVALFLLFFDDSGLVRIYLPTALVLAVLAGEGLVAACALLTPRLRRPVAIAAALGLAAWLGAVSRQTMLAEEGEPLFLRVFHAPEGFPLPAVRDVHADSLRVLDERLAPGEVVGVDAELVEGAGGAFVRGPFSVLFRLLDAGHDARPFTWRGRPESWPRFVTGIAGRLERAGRTVETGGPYRRVAEDAWGRFALYERVGGGGAARDG